MVCICFSSGLLLVPVVLYLFSGGLCVGLSGLEWSGFGSSGCVLFCCVLCFITQWSVVVL